MYQLKPELIHAGCRRPPPVEAALFQGYLNVLQQYFSEHLLDTEMSIESMMDALINIIRTQKTQALRVALDAEERHRQRMGDSVSAVASWIGEESPEDVKIPEAYTGEIEKYIREQHEKISALLHLVQQRSISSIIGLARETKNKLDGKPCTIDEIFHRIQECIGKEEYSLPFDEIHKLAFLAYLPNHLRYAIQECLLHNALITTLGTDRLSQYYKQYLTSSVLAHEHWKTLVTEYGASEKVQIALIAQTAQKQTALSAVSRYVAEEDISDDERRVYESTAAKFRQVEARMYDNNPSLPLAFSCTDYSHCFGLGSTILYFEIHAEKLKQPLQKKPGALCAIFEDSGEQAEIYRHQVQHCSPYTLFSELHDAPSIREASQNPHVHCLVLDIQYGDDATAGIRLTQEVVKAKMQQITEQNTSADASSEPLIIIVWSTSDAHVQTATRELREYIRQHDPDRNYISFGMNERAEQKEMLHIVIQSKYAPLGFPSPQSASQQ